MGTISSKNGKISVTFTPEEVMWERLYYTVPVEPPPSPNMVRADYIANAITRAAWKRLFEAYEKDERIRAAFIPLLNNHEKTRVSLEYSGERYIVNFWREK